MEDNLIMKTLDLGYNSKARVWINESPGIIYPVIEVITQDIQTELTEKFDYKQATIEMMIAASPRICYGLLGVKFIPNSTGKLSLEILVSPENEALFEESLAKGFDTVRIGCTKEYSQSVIKGVRQSLNHQVIQGLGSGVICFDVAAHGEISSSNKLFCHLATTLINLLLLNTVSNEKEITELVKTP